MKPSRMVLVVFLAAAVLWVGYRAYRAHFNLVTLKVSHMDVHRVVSKLEWQTWERIVLNKNVGGNVTLNVHNVPLDEVLNIIGLQTDSRWTRLYPLYSNQKSFTAFKKVLHGDLTPDGNGWLALQQLAAWQQMGLGGFANRLREENKLVSAQLINKDVAFTALALSRFSKAQLVPEDGITRSVNLTLQEVPFDKAVAKVARQVKRKWTRIYTLQPLNAPVLVRKPPPDPADTNATPSIDTNVITTAQAPQVLPPERALEALVSTMTPDERQQTMDQIVGAMQAGIGGSSANGQQGAQSPAAQAAAAAAQQDIETRIENRLKDGTIEQRLAHDRRVLDSKKAAAAKQ
jgi:hypothetical protein